MSTKLHPLVPSIPVGQFEPLTELQCKQRNLPSTPKSKPRLGIENGRTICWAEPNFELYDHQVLKAFAKANELPVAELLAKVLMQWFEDNRTELYAATEGMVEGEAEAVDLEKQIAAMERAIARKQMMLAAKTAATEATTE